MGYGGAVSTAWGAGGDTGSNSATTEEWNSASNVVKTITY